MTCGIGAGGAGVGGLGFGAGAGGAGDAGDVGAGDDGLGGGGAVVPIASITERSKCRCLSSFSLRFKMAFFLRFASAVALPFARLALICSRWASVSSRFLRGVLGSAAGGGGSMVTACVSNTSGLTPVSSMCIHCPTKKNLIGFSTVVLRRIISPAASSHTPR